MITPSPGQAPLQSYIVLPSFQAAIIARKKESTAEKLNDSRNELATLEEEIGEKRTQVQSFAGETLSRPNDLKNYINSLRGKSNAYKKKKGELSEFRAEYGVLSRTLELLQVRTSLIFIYACTKVGWDDFWSLLFFSLVLEKTINFSCTSLGHPTINFSLSTKQIKNGVLSELPRRL